MYVEVCRLYLALCECGLCTVVVQVGFVSQSAAAGLASGRQLATPPPALPPQARPRTRSQVSPRAELDVQLSSSTVVIALTLG